MPNRWWVGAGHFFLYLQGAAESSRTSITLTCEHGHTSERDPEKKESRICIHMLSAPDLRTSYITHAFRSLYWLVPRKAATRHGYTSPSGSILSACPCLAAEVPPPRIPAGDSQTGTWLR